MICGIFFSKVLIMNLKAWITTNDRTDALDFDRLRSSEVVERSHSRPQKLELKLQMFKNRSHKNGFSLPQCKVQIYQDRHQFGSVRHTDR